MNDKRSARREVEQWYESAIIDAKGGDWDMADFLISDFATLAKSPADQQKLGGMPTALVDYIASCLADWRKENYDDARYSFFLNRQSHAPRRKVGGRHIRAYRTFLLVRARGKGIDAAYVAAASTSGLSEDQVRALVQDQSSADRKDDILETVVFHQINRRLHDRVKKPPRKKYQRRA